MTIVHWIHAIAGALWTGATGAFVIAAAALSPQSERSGFAMRVAPRLLGLGAIAATVLLATGIANLIAAAGARDSHLAPEFVGVLAAKTVVFATMVVLLAAGARLAARMRSDGAQTERTSERLMRINAAIAAMGTIALGLGVWLMGS